MALVNVPWYKNNSFILVEEWRKNMIDMTDIEYLGMRRRERERGARWERIAILYLPDA